MSSFAIAVKRLDLPGVLSLFKRTVSGSNRENVTSVVPKQPQVEKIVKKNPFVLNGSKVHGRWFDIKAKFKPVFKAALKDDVYTFRRTRESVRGIMHTLKAAKSKPQHNVERSYDRANLPSWSLKEARIWELIPVCAVNKLRKASKKLSLPSDIHFSELKSLIRHSAGSFKKHVVVAKPKSHDYRPPLGTFGAGAAS